MKRVLSLAVAAMMTGIVLSAATPATTAANKEKLTGYVNPRIGTGGHGHVFLGANVPFGFVQLGPTEHTRGWDWCSGYHDSDSLIIGFGHLHLSGTGVGDLGDIAFLPVSSVEERELRFSHADERVAPGYYALRLRQPDVEVELSATQRVGVHRYRFSQGVKKPLLRIDLRQGVGWDRVTDSKLLYESPTLLTGYRKSKGWADNQQVYFAAAFSAPVKVLLQQGDTVMVVAVSDSKRPLMVKCALSAVSVDDAKANLAAEVPHWDFQRVVAAADDAWNEQLGKIRIDTDDADARTIFYTALYHTMTAPSVFCDVTGRYRGSDGNVYDGDFTNYTTLSLWDTYRAAHPLLTLIHPERQRDMAETFIHIFEQQGKLPVWHLMGCETNCMVGNPAIPVLADMVLKGFVSDCSRQEAAYQAMKTSALLDERGLDLLKEYGYLPFDNGIERETVAKGLEYALADDAVARVALLLGKADDYALFHERSKAYRHYFDPTTCFMRAVDSNGRYREPFNPFDGSHDPGDYTEGNGWQYTWLVPHDVEGLMALFGSRERFLEKLDSLFIVQGDLGAEAVPDITGLIGQYAHGNEPSHHIIYLYCYADEREKAARLIRRTMREMYSNAADGLSGNEDVGQMSAWYVLSALGLYQVEPAGGRYVIGCPLFREAAVQVGGGRTFTVRAPGNSGDEMYVKSVTLNGMPYDKPWLDYRDIVRGGVLELQMARPN